jgi:uncharacterized RmlC-like cupin family protein
MFIIRTRQVATSSQAVSPVSMVGLSAAKAGFVTIKPNVNAHAKGAPKRNTVLIILSPVSSSSCLACRSCFLEPDLD